MPRVALIHHGAGEWRPPTARWGECEHKNLRFDPRFGLPVSTYCLDCGEAYIPPFHGRTDEEIAEARARGAELYRQLVGSGPDG
jgi:hypothetical protein